MVDLGQSWQAAKLVTRLTEPRRTSLAQWSVVSVLSETYRVVWQMQWGGPVLGNEVR